MAWRLFPKPLMHYIKIEIDSAHLPSEDNRPTLQCVLCSATINLVSGVNSVSATEDTTRVSQALKRSVAYFGVRSFGPLMTCVVRRKLRISRRAESHSFASRTRHCLLRRRFFFSPLMFAACRSHFPKFAAFRVAVADFAGRFTEATNSKSCEPPPSLPFRMPARLSHSHPIGISSSERDSESHICGGECRSALLR